MKDAEPISNLVAWQTAQISLMHALIRTHHSPRVLYEAFEASMESMMAALISSPAHDAMLEKIERERDSIRGMFEARIPKF